MRIVTDVFVLALAMTMGWSATTQAAPPTSATETETAPLALPVLPRDQAHPADCCEELKKEIARLRWYVKKLEKNKIDKNTGDLASLGIRVSDNEEKLDAVVTGTDPSNYRPNILAKMAELEVFKEEMKKATQGKFIFHNHSGGWQKYYVNGSPWWVRKGTSHVWAPIGKVIIHKYPASTGTGAELESWKFNKSTRYFEQHFYVF